MSSDYSCSPEDDFFQSLDQSLAIAYSSQMMSNFISDLLVAINNIDDDPDEEFIFYDDETGSNTSEYFTPSSQTNAFDGLRPIQLRRNEVAIASTSEAGNTDISVDMFDDEDPQKTLHENESNSGQESDNMSVDMFAEFQNDVEVMGADCSDKIMVNELEKELETNAYHDEQMIIDKSSNEGFRSDLEIANSINENSNVELPQNIDASCAISKDEEHLHLNECPGVDISTKQILQHQQIESKEAAAIEKEKLSQSIDNLVCVPSNITHSTNDKSTYYEPYVALETSLSVGLETSQRARQPVQLDSNESTIIHVISPMKEKSSQEGSISESECLSRCLFPIDETSNKSMHSSSRGSGFRGFSSVASMRNKVMIQRPIGGSSQNGSDLNSTICEDYEILNNFMPRIQRPTSSASSSSFLGFSHVSSRRQRAMFQNSIRCASRNSDLNTTLCQEYEMANSIVAEMNATQVNNFNLDQAYSQCFLESQNQVM